MIIGFPEPHVREALLRALRAHLVLEDRKDDDVPALAPVRLRLAQHAFLLEPVATERVDAGHCRRKPWSRCAGSRGRPSPTPASGETRRCPSYRVTTVG